MKHGDIYTIPELVDTILSMYPNVEGLIQEGIPKESLKLAIEGDIPSLPLLFLMLQTVPGMERFGFNLIANQIDEKNVQVQIQTVKCIEQPHRIGLNPELHKELDAVDANFDKIFVNCYSIYHRDAAYWVLGLIDGKFEDRRVSIIGKGWYWTEAKRYDLFKK